MRANPPAVHRSGYVALVGRPNVGKSTLMNALLGQKIAAISPRPQTTRRRQLGILSLPNAQIVFVDTPGMHQPAHKLGEYMNQTAEDALKSADIILWLVDGSVTPTDEDQRIAARLLSMKNLPPVLLGVNKIDLLAADLHTERASAYRALYSFEHVAAFSAADGSGQDNLLTLLTACLPPGEPLFDPDQVTDLYEREIAAELIREAALHHLRDEIPHAMAVRVDEFTERDETGAYIHATLLVERENHKAIVIGKGGEMLKKIGSTARREIEAMSGRKVYLELRVKVNLNWRNKPDALRWLGYARAKD
ncbi:MAG: GTPase Era [Chloroflexota bacterium]